MIPLIGIGLALGALIIWYMRGPRFLEVRLSAARFLGRLPSAKSQRWRWSLSSPIRQWRFYLRTAWFALLAVGCLNAPLFETEIGKGSLHLTIVIDVSHSMSVSTGDGTALDAAVAVSEQALERLAGLDSAVDRCAMVWTVGATIRQLGTVNVGEIRRRDLRPEPEGGDPVLLGKAARASSPDCTPTHSLIVTDRPAPADLDMGLGERSVWIDVTQPAANVGISGVRGLPRSLLGGGPQAAEIVQFGTLPDHLLLSVDSGGKRRRVDIDVSTPGPWFVPLMLEPGSVELALSPGGVYSGDDRVRFEYRQVKRVQVDWHLPKIGMPSVRGWIPLMRNARDRPGLRVLPLADHFSEPDPQQVAEPPTVLVYEGFRLGFANVANGALIGLFVEDSPLLDAVSLDVLEQALEHGIDELPEGYVPVLATDADRPVMAIRFNPRAAIVPGPRIGGDPEIERLSLTVFFNAVRWVTAQSRRDVSFKHIDADGRQILDAVLESDTADPNRSAGAIESIRPVAAVSGDVRLWPWLIALASILLAWDRAMGVSWWRGWS